MGGKCSGFAAYYANDKHELTGYITLIAIHSHFRRKGFGRHLIRSCFDDMTASGMRRVRLEVMSDNTGAISFYTAEGFRVISEASPESFYMLKEFHITE